MNESEIEFRPAAGIIEMNRALSEVDEMFRTVMQERDKALKQRDEAEKNYMKLVKENSELAQECAELQDRNKMLEKKCIELARKLSDTVDYRLKKWFGAK